MTSAANTLSDLVRNTSSLAVPHVIECLRTLRNACAGNNELQNSLALDTSVVTDVCTALNTVLAMPRTDERTLCLRIGVQFLGNFIVNNQYNQHLIWSQCASLLRSLMMFKDDKLSNYCAMVLHNIILGNPHIIQEIISSDYIEGLCTIGLERSDFALFVIEHLICQDNILQQLYVSRTPEHRLFILDVVEIALKSISVELPRSAINFLSSEFKNRSDCILKTVTGSVEDLEPEEVVKLLDILASASSDDPYQEILQEDSSLFISSAYLLKSIHEIGKTGKNCFSPIQKLSAVTGSEPELEKHPVYGFKANLIRILGNLCWKHRKNQDLLRTTGCIPVLLDCCNIDARNPLIIQWVTLAVRNFCEGNRENQDVIAGMNREGVVSSAVLNEMGFTLHADERGNKIGLAPLRSP